MRVLLVQTSFLGDTILSTPVISGIKTLYPEAELWMMTTPLSADLVRRDPLLKGVLTLDKRKGDAGLIGLLRKARKIQSMRFDRAYSLHRSYRTSLLLWLARIPLRIGCSDAKLRFLYHRFKTRDLTQHDVIRNMSILAGEIPLGPDTMPMRLFAPALNELRADLRAYLPPSGGYAVLVPGSAWRTKMWHWEGFREVLRYLLSRNMGTVLLGSAEERQVCAKVADGLPAIDLSGRTTIAEVMTIVQNACLVVCNDSMSLHMASAMKIPTVVIFCATSPAFGYGPWQNRAVVVEQPNLKCKPCRPHGSMQCPNGTEACMRGPTSEVVIDAVAQMLRPQGAEPHAHAECGA
jgi:heptosyltransferase-2